MNNLEINPIGNFILKPYPIMTNKYLIKNQNLNNFNHLNRSQKDAIFGVVKSNSKVCLIHGPPGTGKTQTIVGLIELIHIYEQQRKNDKPSILVCTPSNGAVDELVNRIMSIGFKSESLGHPKVVRIGKSAEINYDINKY